MKWRSVGIRARLWMAAGLPALLAVVLLMVGFLDRYNTELAGALRDRARAGAAQLAGAADFHVFANNQLALQRLLDVAMDGDPQMVGAGVFRPDGTLLASAGQLVQDWPAFGGKEWVGVGDHLVVVVVPVGLSSVAGSDLFSESATERGVQPTIAAYAVVKLSLSGLVEQKRNVMVWALVTTCVVLLLAGLLSSWMASGVTGPVRHIGRVVARIGEGDLNARAYVRTPTELAVLASGINGMAAKVAVGQEQLKAQVDLATEELRRQKEAAELAARIDPLTGLASRRAFTESADTEIRRALRYRLPLCLIMVDLDHFKSINDTHGHATGDAVLVSFAHVVSQLVREVDVVGRMGGEEFVVLLPSITVAEATHVAERMRQAVVDGELMVNGQPLHYTASFGVAEFDPRQLTLSSLLSRADVALYKAKRLGRNRVEVSA